MNLVHRIVVIAVSTVVLAAGLILGLRPAGAPLTLVSPVVKEVTVTCGIAFLPTVPPAGADGLIALESEPGVALPRSTYAEHCADAVGWSQYAAWGLTGVGLVALAVLLTAGRAPASSSTTGRRGRR